MNAEKYLKKQELKHKVYFSGIYREMILEAMNEYLASQTNPIFHSKNEKKAENIMNIVGEYFGINKEIFRQRIKINEYVKCRQISVYFIKKLCNGISQEKIMYMVGNLDHSSFLYTIKTVENHILTEKTYRNQIEEIHLKIINNATAEYIQTKAISKASRRKKSKHNTNYKRRIQHRKIRKDKENI